MEETKSFCHGSVSEDPYCISSALKDNVEKRIKENTNVSFADIVSILRKTLQDILHDQWGIDFADAVTVKVDSFGICSVNGIEICELAEHGVHMENSEKWIARWNDENIFRLLNLLYSK